ncbi:hypothetical protein UP06_29070 [Bradyrhizobium sp. LTSP857]|nr:hypothetical protein UP06_29070 [Bradyrhizobium sp. LTSP857]
MSGPLFLALKAEDDDGAMRQHLFRFRAHFFEHTANIAACAPLSAERFPLISFRLQTVSEDWAAVMCSLCQYATATGEA